MRVTFDHLPSSKDYTFIKIKINMKKFSFLLAMSLLIAGTGCDEETISHIHGDKFAKFNADMRLLWSDHALWTRNVIVNVIDDLPGTTEAVNRLLKNQDDIGISHLSHHKSHHLATLCFCRRKCKCHL